ncbi:hypothetical protein [Lentibacillus juripiscarius]
MLVQINVPDHGAMTNTGWKMTDMLAITDLNTLVQLDIYKNTFQYI